MRSSVAGKAGRQEAHKQALVALNTNFEEKFVEAVTLALGLNAAQAKKFAIKRSNSYFKSTWY